MMHSLHYRKPRLVESKQGWYIKYSFKVPPEIRHIYGNKTWYPFRIKMDMNRRKGQDRVDYTNWLLTNITKALEAGYNPFEFDLQKVAANLSAIPDIVTAEHAFKIFLDTWAKRGLEPVSFAKYKKFVNRLAEWLHLKKLLYTDIKTITTDHIEAFLSDGRKTYNFSNREYNNTLDFIRTCFNYLVKKEFISKNPCADIDKLKTKSQKHKYYDKKSMNDIVKAMLAIDPYCYLAAQTVYYMCIRSDKELQNFKVGNIIWEQNMVLLESEGTKSKAARYVPMDNNIKYLLIKHGVDKAPADYFVFGIDGKPSAKPYGRTFFTKRFRKLRTKAGLDPNFTLYGFKHTRIVHLKQDGLDDATIMKLTGHTQYESYAKYLRDLGMDANPQKINAVSRLL